MLLVKSVYDLSEIVSEINKDDPYRAKMGFNRVFRWKCFRTQLPRVKFETCESRKHTFYPFLSSYFPHIFIQMFPSRFMAITETKEKKMTTGFTAAFLIAGAGH